MTRGFLPDPKGPWGWLTLLVIVAARLAAAAGPPPGEGEPFMQHFSPRVYQGPAECACAAHDTRGVMYFGSVGVVLEYDGSTWRQIPMPSYSQVGSVAYEAATDTVFVGTSNDLGYLKILPGGARTFVSLLKQLPPDAQDVGNVSDIYDAPDGIYFVGATQVMRRRKGSFKTWKLPTATKLRSSYAAGCLYVSNPEIGLLRLVNDAFEPASDDPLFRRASVRAVLADADGALLVGTFHDGQFALRDGVARPVDGECSSFLKEKGIFKILRLQDGSLAVATDTAGLLVLNPARRFRNRVDDAAGLHGNNIDALFEDAEGGLWIGLFSGITRAEVNSPLTVLRAGPNDEMSNSNGAAWWFGTLVLGNASALYRIVPADPAAAVGARLERLPGTANSSTSVCSVENGLLTISNGKIEWLDADARLVCLADEITSPNELCASRVHPGRVYVADGSGRVFALHADGASRRWINDGLVAETGKTGDFSLAESARGDLWLGTAGAGLFRIELNPAGAATVTTFFGRPGPLRGQPYVKACGRGGPLDFQAAKRLCRLDDSGQAIRPLTEFGIVFNDGSLSVGTLLNYDAQSLWITARNTSDPDAAWFCGRVVAGEPGRAPVFQPLPHKIEEMLGEVTVYHPAEAQPAPLATLLIVGAAGNGVVRLDVRQWETQRAPPPFTTLIRRAVTASGAAAASGEPPILGDPLPYARNSAHFEFAAGTLAYGAAPRFQTRLVNFGAGEWSGFSDRDSVDYLNLPEGRYAFEVRARNADGQLARVASLPFRILPPWQRTPWACALYALTTALGIYALVRWRGQQLRRRNDALEALVGARTGELRGREAELVRARDDAERANRAKSAFLANMSHELRTPLNAILGYAQILLKHADLPARSREQITVIGHSGGHLLSLINEVLDLSKIEVGKLTLSHVDFSLCQLLDEVGAAFRPRFGEKRLMFTETRAPDLPTVVHLDPSRLRQVLFNLLSNASKFTNRGNVSLDVRLTEAGRARFEVADTGVGIEERELGDIFLAFHQAGDSRLAAQGAGLGLAISQRLVGLLGGRIEVESVPSRGSRFWFDLPLLPVKSLGELSGCLFPGQAQGKVMGYEGAPRRLLLVDDVAENRNLLWHFLQPLGFEIEEAADGSECLTACARQLPDAVLLDLRLGTLDGFEVARALRARINGTPLGIIAISASVFESDRQQATDAGCDDFLPKPFEEAQLLGALSRVLGLRWLHAAPAAVSPSVPADAVLGGNDEPLLAETDALFELSLRGDIVGIRKRLDALRSAGASDGTAVLVRRLEPLVAAYQMDGIHALLLEVQNHARS